MGKKIFVSYKYADSNVEQLNGNPSTTVRSYVDEFEGKLDKSSNIYKGESDDEDLSDLTDNQIWEKLKDGIFDSSITIVMISPNMKEPGKSDKSQWIPWEIAFSLRETIRNDRTSSSNAVLAVVLPNKNGSYSYYLSDNNCIEGCNCRTLGIGILFDILKKNMFNQKNKEKFDCKNGRNVYSGEPSYILSVKWSDFISDYNKYINIATGIKDRIDDYEIKINV